MKQQFGSWTLDMPTREESRIDLQESLGHAMGQHIAERYRGVKPIKLPPLAASAGGTTLILPPSGGAEPIQCGPRQGYFWRVSRVTIASSGSDTGAVSLFAGSDPGNTAGQFLIDANLKVGQAYYPSNWGLLLFPGEFLYASVTSVANNTYRLSGVATEVPAEMVGKLLM